MRQAVIAAGGQGLFRRAIVHGGHNRRVRAHLVTPSRRRRGRVGKQGQNGHQGEEKAHRS